MKKLLVPIAFAGAVIIGILIGNILAENANKHNLVTDNTPSVNGKIDMLLSLIDMQYVDTVDRDELTEKIIPNILSNLDPHSVYIPEDELQIVNDDLGSSFSGIGIQFNIQRDTIMVVSVIRGGPSEKAGLMPGDRIVTVDDSSFVGKAISNDKAVKKLRGPKNTKVKVGVKRFGTEETIDYTITRGDIPTNSVDASFLIEKNIGYVKVGKFGSSTYEEFVEALSKLKLQGAEKYIIDLRENSGGYLQAAIFMINEFLKEGEMIVYTQGKAQKREDAIADGTGEFQDAPVAILIDEWSASASEIFAGAIQDNDRGVVIGRRSFGKGLVQEQIPMRDGSAVRLTIARYYTPSGRCIQKPYDNIDNYEKEVYERYINGELDSDSAKTPSDSMKYYTKNGRVVYGGGGITPDIIITRDTLGATPYYIKLHNSGTLYEYAFRYVDDKRKELSSMTEEELCKFLNKEPLAQLAMDYGAEKKITTLLPVKKDTKELIQRRVKEYVVKDVLGDQSYFSVVNQNDNIIKAALKELNKKDNKKKINK